MTPSPKDVTELLLDWGNGNQAALDQLMPLVYDELHRLAHSRVRRSGDLTLLDTTSLVHESYLRLEKSGSLGTNRSGSVRFPDAP